MSHHVVVIIFFAIVVAHRPSPLPTPPSFLPGWPSDLDTDSSALLSFPQEETRNVNRPCQATMFSIAGYWAEGFLTLQRAVDQAIIGELYPGYDPGTVQLNVQRFPYPPYNDDKFVLVLQQQFPVILMLSFVFSALHIVKDIVMEKEKRIKVSHSRESRIMVKLAQWMF